MTRNYIRNNENRNVQQQQNITTVLHSLWFCLVWCCTDAWHSNIQLFSSDICSWQSANLDKPRQTNDNEKAESLNLLKIEDWRIASKLPIKIAVFRVCIKMNGLDRWHFQKTKKCRKQYYSYSSSGWRIRSEKHQLRYRSAAWRFVELLPFLFLSYLNWTVRQNRNRIEVIAIFMWRHNVIVYCFVCASTREMV